MRYLLSIILCLWASCVWAFPPGFIGAVTSAGSVAGCDDGVLSNGCFDSGTTGWTTPLGGTFTVTDGVASLNQGTVDYAVMHTDIVADMEGVWDISLDITQSTGIAVVGMVGYQSCDLTSNQGWHTCSVTVPAGNPQRVRVQVSSTTDGATIYVDNIKVTKR
jgi:hypothetical protein